MIWLYRLQQRLSITRQEGLAILTLTALFVTGLTARHVQEQQVPPVAVDSLVARPSTSFPASDSSSSNTVAPPSSEDPLNVNSASLDALEKLPGIGPVLAKRIKRYRSKQRPFQRIGELRRVRGIGAKTLSSLRPMVDVTPPEGSVK